MTREPPSPDPAHVDRKTNPPSSGQHQSPAKVAAAHAYAELAGMVLGVEPLGVILTRIAQLSAKFIPEADEVSLTLLDRGQPRTIAFSGARAAVLDERQYQTGRGPCLDAAASGNIVMVEPATDEFYVEFSQQSARAGITHVFSIGLPAIAPNTTGALNVYSAGAAFSSESIEVAAGFGNYIAVAMTNAAVHAGALAEVEQLRTALISRAVIEQAKGVIIAQQHCSEDAAFAVLRSFSNDRNLKLRDIAQQIVKRAQNRLNFPGPPSRPGENGLRS